MLTFLCLLLLAHEPSRYEARLLPLIQSHQGKVALSLRHLQTNETYTYQPDEVMPTASLIKVAVLAELYTQVQESKVKLSDAVTLKKEDKVPGAGILTDCFSDGVSFPVQDAARLMITVSDNTATNLVIDKVGVKEINERMQAWGYKNTRLNAKVYRGSTTSIDPVQTKKYGLGSTSASDMVQFFAQLHEGKMVSPAASKEMLALLNLCHDETMFRRFLPFEKVTAHKTGATSAVRTSAGILTTDSGPIAICVMTAENKDQSWNPDNAGQVLIGRIAEEVVAVNKKAASKAKHEVPKTASTAIAPLQQPLQVHPSNPRYFLWNGKATAIVSSGEHYGAVVNLDFDYIKYLDTLKAEGMHYTRIFTGTYIEPVGAFGIERNTLAPKPERFITPWKRSNIPGYASGGNKFNMAEWDPEYLQRLKGFLTAASERGIVVEVTLFCSTYSDKQWNVSPFKPANTSSPLDHVLWKTLQTSAVSSKTNDEQLKLVRYLVQELNSFNNIVWEIQNEPWADNHTLSDTLNPYILDKTTFPNRIEVTKPDSVAWQDQIARTIRHSESTLPKKHLIFQNVANFKLAIHPQLDLVKDVDAIHFHYAYPEAALWNQPLKKPICCDETGFAGKNDDVYRSQAWAFMLSGGGLWNHLDYSFSVGKEDGTDVQPKSPGGGSKTLRQQLSVLSRFLNSHDLAAMKPDNTILQNAPGLFGYCLANPGVEYACYLTGRVPSTVQLNLPPGTYAIQWINSRTGEVLAASDYVPGPGKTLARPAYQDDIALSVRRKGR